MSMSKLSIYKLFILFSFALTFGGRLFAWDGMANERFFKIFAQNLAKKYKMEYLNIGVGTIVDSNVVALDTSLVDHRSLTLEQARPIVVAMIRDLLHEVYHNPAYAAYLKKNGQEIAWYDPVLSPKRFGIKIAFWDKDVNRPSPPYLSQIKISEGLIHYFYANPDQSLGTPFTETFEQAMELVQKLQNPSQM
jgi:hypothetical protein